MAKNIVVKKPLRKIVNIHSALPRVDAEAVARGIGASIEGTVPLARDPVSLQSLAELVRDSLISSGGRPGRKDVVERKIPITEEEWSRLNDLADFISGQGVKASPGQVAGVLLHSCLRKLAPVQESNRNVSEDRICRILEAAANSGIPPEAFRPLVQELLEKYDVGAGLEQLVD